jgi:DNA-directed RNA polymerase specialized sigma24 family protein
MPPGEPERAALSMLEVAAAIRSLPEAGWHRLRKIARYFAYRCPLEADDLLQDAFTRAVAGERHCPAHVDLIRFLSEVMHSIASDTAKTAKRQADALAKCGELRLVSLAPATDEDEADPLALPCPSPEATLAGEQEAAHIKDTFLRLFDDDLIALAIIEGDMEEMDGEDIRALTGLSKVDYASKRRFVRRSIDKNFPEGWKP